jgi:hypothetical protein
MIVSMQGVIQCPQYYQEYEALELLMKFELV